MESRIEEEKKIFWIFPSQRINVTKCLAGIICLHKTAINFFFFRLAQRRSFQTYTKLYYKREMQIIFRHRRGFKSVRTLIISAGHFICGTASIFSLLFTFSSLRQLKIFGKANNFFFFFNLYSGTVNNIPWNTTITRLQYEYLLVHSLKMHDLSIVRDRTCINAVLDALCVSCVVTQRRNVSLQSGQEVTLHAANCGQLVTRHARMTRNDTGWWSSSDEHGTSWHWPYKVQVALEKWANRNGWGLS